MPLPFLDRFSHIPDSFLHNVGNVHANERRTALHTIHKYQRIAHSNSARSGCLSPSPTHIYGKYPGIPGSSADNHCDSPYPSFGPDRFHNLSYIADRHLYSSWHPFESIFKRDDSYLYIKPLHFDCSIGKLNFIFNWSFYRKAIYLFSKKL